MEKEFIPYEEALALKGLGYDEECFGYYTDGTPRIMYKDQASPSAIREHTVCKAPLHQQTFRWFREKHKLTHEIDEYDGRGHTWGVYENGYVKHEVDNIIDYDEAELDCVKQMIEMVKEKV